MRLSTDATFFRKPAGSPSPRNVASWSRENAEIADAVSEIDRFEQILDLVSSVLATIVLALLTLQHLH